MSDQQTLRAFFADAFGGAKRHQLERYFDPNLIIIEAESLPFGGVYHGCAGYFELVSKVFSTWRNVQVEVNEYVGENDTVVVLATMTGELKDSGHAFAIPIAEVWRFRDGLISQIQPYYFDTAAIAPPR